MSIYNWKQWRCAYLGYYTNQEEHYIKIIALITVTAAVFPT